MLFEKFLLLHIQGIELASSLNILLVLITLGFVPHPNLRRAIL
jgi:hypothetical protein